MRLGDMVAELEEKYVRKTEGYQRQYEALGHLWAENEAMRAAITRTLAAWESTQYVDGMETREAWLVMERELGPYRAEDAAGEGRTAG